MDINENMLYIIIGLGLILSVFLCSKYFKSNVSEKQNDEHSDTRQETENTEQSNHQYKCDGDKCVMIHHE